jgi:uncharacterized protein (DUF2267 family)
LFVSGIVEAVASVSPPLFRPILPDDESNQVQEEIRILMKQCWAEQPNERPTFEEVSKMLRNSNKGK